MNSENLLKDQNKKKYIIVKILDLKIIFISLWYKN